MPDSYGSLEELKVRKNFGKKTWFYPLPVLIVGSYDENGKADAMNAAWGGIYDSDKVMLSLSATHQTTQNIKARGAFTISFADAAHVKAADYVGLVSAKEAADKMEKAGFHAIKSEFVDAPLIEELPMALECKLIKINEDGNVIGEIVNVNADEKILGSDGAIDAAKLEMISFDPVHNAYVKMGEKVGNAFSDGAELE